MVTAVELLRQGRHEEIWDMCCGYLKMNLPQFMDVQKRLLLGQIEVFNHSIIGQKVTKYSWPQTVEEFRKSVPLTTYADYCPELAEKREDVLPEAPAQWVHTSGRTGEFPCKWVPISNTYARQLGSLLYGIGLISASSKWGDLAPFTECPNFIYTVAPRPYMSGALASLLQLQTPSHYYPSLAKAEKLPFEERIKMGFEEALNGGLDYFFGLSLVLSAVGSKFNQSAESMNILPYLSKPKALLRLTRGMMKSKAAGRKMLPKDLWNVKGIVTSGLDSSVYREKIKEYWGRYPLDIYSSTEGGVIATQTWDYGGMTFIPNLNFFEFIPEKEHMKWQLDHKYQPKTILLDEVEAGECYEIVITSLHGGVLARYRVGDMIRITALKNENAGINLPQMVFERRADDLLDFAAIRLNERAIWQAIERTGVRYEDWVAFKLPGEMILNVLLEAQGDLTFNKSELEAILFEEILKTDYEVYRSLKEQDDLNNMIKFKLNLTLLPRGTFARYSAQKRAEGADIAHLKPPHISPSSKILSALLSTPEIVPASPVKIATQIDTVKIS